MRSLCVQWGCFQAFGWRRQCFFIAPSAFASGETKFDPDGESRGDKASHCCRFLIHILVTQFLLPHVIRFANSEY